MRSTLQRALLGCTILLGLSLADPATAQSTADRQKTLAQSELSAAESALTSAEAAGAPMLARELYREATERIADARGKWNDDKRGMREQATLRAVEANAAARAAEAQASLVSANSEVRNLRTDITTFGGTATNVALFDPPTTISRGTTSMDRVIVAENALKTARSVGGDLVAPDELKQAEGTLKTARTLAKNDKQNENADHLAYIAEMQARRAEFVARRNAVNSSLPSMRAERRRLAQVVADTRAQEEQQRRLEAEQHAADLRRQLAVESANRQAEQAELERLRQQVAANESQMRTRFDTDRSARIAAEQSYDELQQRYQAALVDSSISSIELEQLRRQVEDQSLALRSSQERERLSETSMGNQINTLQQDLERERAEGRVTADVLEQRETELRRQREELQRLQTDREESERRRVEAETARTAAIAEAERKRSEAEAQSEQLRQQIVEERTRTAQTQSELTAARQELSQRDAASRERIEAMQTALSKLASTRTSERGFIVTLPGLFFDTGKSVLKTGARNTLTKIAEQLRINDETSIAVEGHTDSVGSEALNQTLSEKRAAAVRDYLVSRGVPAARITMSGLGESAPIATNDTPAGRQQNRRVELVITQ
jgi:outer membrane protein OmpA-like peptidoglycan-associated protein